MRLKLLAAFLSTVMMFLTTTHGEDSASGPKTESGGPGKLSELMNFDLETLLNMEVTSVARKGQRFEDATAAISVITNEDLRRSGSTTIADSLRMVPGMNVAQIEANRWAISSRGFSGPFATKLLVMMDGRSVYSPMFSGVYWEVQDTMLEDLDRIEVVRGPGGTMWGANAVNGVINVLTKTTKETLGTLIVTGGGDNERAFGGIRHGGKLGENAHYRVYVKSFYRDGGLLPNGEDADEDWNVNRSGFRVDWDISDTSVLTLQGDVYDGKMREVYPTNELTLDRTHLRTDVEGANILSRLKHTWSDHSDITIQMYYDHAERLQPRKLNFGQSEQTADLEIVHRFSPLSWNSITWGAGYRWISDEVEEGLHVSRKNATWERDIWSAFIEDELSIVPDRLTITLGSKFEDNTFTGFEVQPSARLLFNASENHRLWAAVSRAVRTPARFERDSRILLGSLPPQPPLVPPYSLSVVGNENFGSEHLVAYEIGYRVQPSPRISTDLAIFFNQYDDLRNFYLPQRMIGAAGIADELHINNFRKGETYGGELSVTWKPVEWWKLIASYSYLFYHTWVSVPSSGDEPSLIAPQHQGSLRSLLDLPHNLQFDSSLNYVDELQNQRIPGYTRVDLRLGWRPSARWELSFVVQNLLDDRHPEFAPSYSVGATEIERSIFGKLTYTFSAVGFV